MGWDGRDMEDQHGDGETAGTAGTATNYGWMEIPWFPASTPKLLSRRVYSALLVLDVSVPSVPVGMRRCVRVRQVWGWEGEKNRERKVEDEWRREKKKRSGRCVRSKRSRTEGKQLSGLFLVALMNKARVMVNKSFSDIPLHLNASVPGCRASRLRWWSLPLHTSSDVSAVSGACAPGGDISI